MYKTVSNLPIAGYQPTLWQVQAMSKYPLQIDVVDLACVPVAILRMIHLLYQNVHIFLFFCYSLIAHLALDFLYCCFIFCSIRRLKSGKEGQVQYKRWCM